MGPTDTVNHTIDSLLNDWSKIVYLYHLVHDFAEQFKNGSYIHLKISPNCVIKNDSFLTCYLWIFLENFQK